MKSQSTRFHKEARAKMENMGSNEQLFFDPATGKLLTRRPANNDKAIAVDMNKQGSGGFFVFAAKGARNDLNDFVYATMVAHLEYK